LELKESSDVVVDVSSPHACLDDRGKVIVLDNNVGSIVSNVGSGFHCEPNVSFLKVGSVVGSVSSDRDDVSKLLEASDHDVFVVGSRPGEDLEVVSDFLHVDWVSNDFLVFIGSHDKNLFSRVLVNESSNELTKLGSLHAGTLILLLLIVQDSAFLCNRNGGDLVVSGDHSDSHASFVALDDCSGNFFSDDVFDSGDADQGVAVHFNIVDFASFHFLLVVFASFFGLEILVSECNSSQGVLGVGLNLLVELSLHGVVEHGFDTMLVQEVRTSLKDNFGSSLGVESLLVAVLSLVGVVEFKDG